MFQVALPVPSVCELNLNLKQKKSVNRISLDAQIYLIFRNYSPYEAAINSS
ncbi:hypothetical protein BC749_1011269 [Flavobacterium araucananum]|nr:hypothetical protein BC749_1011269 [Flavobacterium araucananum]